MSSRPVRSPTCARRGYPCPPKLRCEIRPSFVRSKRAPQVSSSQTRSVPGRVQLGHPPLVEELAAAHRVAEVDLPVVPGVHVAHGGRDAALRHHRMGLAEQGLADHGGTSTCSRARSPPAVRRHWPPHHDNIPLLPPTTVIRTTSIVEGAGRDSGTRRAGDRHAHQRGPGEQHVTGVQLCRPSPRGDSARVFREVL